jgi:hypothetical protein
MAAFEAARDPSTRPVDIDLTLPDTQPPAGSTRSDANMNIDTALGSSADKPIELDLDGMDIDITNMSDLFGDAADDGSTDANAGLFSPATVNHELSSVTGQDGKSVKEENLGMEILDALSAVGNPEGQDDLFASFSQSTQSSGQHQLHSNAARNEMSIALDPSSSGAVGAPSPGTILANFAASQMNTNGQSSSSDTHNLPDGDPPFDLTSIDLSSVFNGEPGSETNMAEIEELLKSGGFGSTA